MPHSITLALAEKLSLQTFQVYGGIVWAIIAFSVVYMTINWLSPSSKLPTAQQYIDETSSQQELGKGDVLAGAGVNLAINCHL